MSILIVIPARYGSQRLPGKVLLRYKGKTLLQYVYENALCHKGGYPVVIATDSERVAKEAENFGASVCLTSPHHRSGTERVAEVAKKFPDFPYVINLQGDEPELPPCFIDRLAELLMEEKAPVVTLATKCSKEEAQSPHNVKVVRNQEGFALYFSRSLIPYPRREHTLYLRHIGIYGFQREALIEFAASSPSSLEEAEGLEQLRILEKGGRIYVELVGESPPGIDTKEDWEAFVERMKKRAISS